MRKFKWIIPFFLIMISVSATVAQQCLSVVNEALALTSNRCNITERNEVCYGYTNVTALPSINPNDFNFDEQGDIVPFDDIAAMELSPFDEASGDWGVVVARLQAQLPDTLPGQNVTIVLFGGVTLQNDGVSTEGIQAFRFTTGIGSGGCLGLPPDGIIIETPEGSSFLTFEINGTEVTLGSTAFLQTYADEDGSNQHLRIGMLDGLGFISAKGTTIRIETGQQTAIPLDTNLEASGEPSPAGEFNMGTLSVMSGFVEGLEFNDPEATPETPVVAVEQPTATATNIPVPCTISTDTAFSAGLRVGPGLNRTMRVWLQPNVDVTVTGISSDGEWWQLDKFEAFPSGANSVVELWVNVNEVTTNGDCDQIGNASAPPIIAPPREQGPSPTPSDDDNVVPPIETEEFIEEPIVDIWVEDVDHDLSCSTINWYIEYVSAVYLVGATANPTPLSGISGSYEVCPTISTTYYVRVVYTDGTQEDFPVFIRRTSF